MTFDEVQGKIRQFLFEKYSSLHVNTKAEIRRFSDRFGLTQADLDAIESHDESLLIDSEFFDKLSCAIDMSLMEVLPVPKLTDAQRYILVQEMKDRSVSGGHRRISVELYAFLRSIDEIDDGVSVRLAERAVSREEFDLTVPESPPLELEMREESDLGC